MSTAPIKFQPYTDPNALANSILSELSGNKDEWTRAATATADAYASAEELFVKAAALQDNDSNGKAALCKTLGIDASTSQEGIVTVAKQRLERHSRILELVNNVMDKANEMKKKIIENFAR